MKNQLAVIDNQQLIENHGITVKKYYFISQKLIEEMAELSEVLNDLLRGKPNSKKITAEYKDVLKYFKQYEDIVQFVSGNNQVEYKIDTIDFSKGERKKIGFLALASLNLNISMSIMQKEICKDLIGKTRPERLAGAYFDLKNSLKVFKKVVDVKKGLYQKKKLILNL
ncbi:MAG: hypothetical protein OIF32_01780 [Campylobacterales bacterium]|nr:hypothetical protein [Campylobacterales bacterium]